MYSIIILIQNHYLVERSINKLKELYINNERYLDILDNVNNVEDAKKYLSYLNNENYNNTIQTKKNVTKLSGSDNKTKTNSFAKIKEIFANINWSSCLVLLLIIIVAVIIVSIIIINIKKQCKNKHKQ